MFQYVVSLGAKDVHGEHSCAGELHPLPNATAALSAAVGVLGRSVGQLWTHSLFERETLNDHADDAQITGFTINRYTDEFGTDHDWFLEPKAVRL